MLKALILMAALPLLPTVSQACASCGCTLSSDWEETSQSPYKLDIRYDYINQNQLRSSTSTISSAAASHLSNNGSPQEVEQYTKNNYLTATGEYTITPSWKIALQMPYILRGHSTLGTASDGVVGGAGGGQYTSNTSSLGDMKLLGRFQGFNEQHNLGIIFGLKLPTGSHTLTGTSTDPTAPGAVAIDRGLEPGTGTTDLVLGAYYNEALNKNWDYFGELLMQFALNEVDQYRPGNGYNFNLGLRYFGIESFTPQIQINTRVVNHDTGANSDTISTGGTLLYLSPGVTVPVTAKVDAYAFFQIPLYQYLEGVQLAPTWTGSVGARYNF